MRALVGLYLVIGILLLVVGFVATGPCPEKNKDVVSDVVFVLGWPVYLYDNVSKGNESAPEWLHRQACSGGVVAYHLPDQNVGQPQAQPQPQPQSGSGSPTH